MGVLSKTRRNQVFSVIATSRIDVSGCSFSNEETPATLKHLESESEFRILRGREYGVWSRIGDEPISNASVSMHKFDDVLVVIANWADKVADWIDVPDLWEESLSQGYIPGELSPDSANTQFTPDEQGVVSTELKAVAESIKKTYELTAEQSAKLDEKFEEAEKASRRMGRKDWGLLFGGAVFSLILADVITPGVAGHILTMMEHGIGHLFSDSMTIRGIRSAGQDRGS
jgi:hypothetical protein